MSWLPKKTVLVPVDLSTASVDALQTAIQLVAQPKDVHVLYVTSPEGLLSVEDVATHDAQTRRSPAFIKLLGRASRFGSRPTHS